jgi:hypothetical protein
MLRFDLHEHVQIVRQLADHLIDALDALHAFYLRVQLADLPINAFEVGVEQHLAVALQLVCSWRSLVALNEHKRRLDHVQIKLLTLVGGKRRSDAIERLTKLGFIAFIKAVKRARDLLIQALRRRERHSAKFAIGNIDKRRTLLIELRLPQLVSNGTQVARQSLVDPLEEILMLLLLNPVVSTPHSDHKVKYSFIVRSQL